MSREPGRLDLLTMCSLSGSVETLLEHPRSNDEGDLKPGRMHLVVRKTDPEIIVMVN